MARQDRSGLRDQIIKASLELGTELGEEGLTMRGIAGRLEVSATALYQHFESKAEILREIRIYGLESLAVALCAGGAIEDPVERMRDMAIRYVHYARDNRWLYSLLMEHGQVEWRELIEDEAKALLSPFDAVRACLREGKESGGFRDDLQVSNAAFQLWAGVHGLSSLLLSGRISEQHPAIPVSDEKAFVESFVRGILRGFTG